MAAPFCSTVSRLPIYRIITGNAEIEDIIICNLKIVLIVMLLKTMAQRKQRRVQGKKSQNVNKEKRNWADEMGELVHHLSFHSHGDSLLYPGIAAEQREHEASDIASPHAAAFGVTIAVRHKVSLMGEKLLR